MRCGIRSKICALSREKLSKFCVSDEESHHRQSSHWHCGLSYNRTSGIRSVCASFLHNSAFFKTHLLTEAAEDVNLRIGQSCIRHNCLNASIKNQKWQSVVQHSIVQKHCWELRASDLLPSLFRAIVFFWVVMLMFWGFLVGCFSFLETRKLFSLSVVCLWRQVCCLLWWQVFTWPVLLLGGCNQLLLG